MPERRLVTRSEAETVSLGRALASELGRGDVVLLEGVLGAGKTALARGLASGLGVPEEEVRSPTFTLVNPYAGRLPVYHVDLYRIENPRDLEELGLEEILGTDGVAIIEWAERLGRWRPPHAYVVRFEDRGGSERAILIEDGRAPGGAWAT
ncbi:MAG TPA: tRNA (adenosine(37)-N6)-threonylcarbamoyltransferase complex ATPase subunit type 1 TsaE [Verrucomicrobiae bacterium]|nr:tRNA (adenosine(37)-N6)-threonylcarbamoyltransferase complex ATPase subunit type 1 TsaE [Verrucomicrobiae bacterium]